MAQLVQHLPRTQKIAGSSPARGSSSFSLEKKELSSGVVACICLVSITDYSCTHVSMIGTGSLEYLISILSHSTLFPPSLSLLPPSLPRPPPSEPSAVYDIHRTSLSDTDRYQLQFVRYLLSGHSEPICCLTSISSETPYCDDIMMTSLQYVCVSLLPNLLSLSASLNSSVLAA